MSENEIENMKKFISWCLAAVFDACDLDGHEIQEQLEGLGMIEERPVNPDENEWGADTLYFLKDEYRIKEQE